MVLTLRMAAPVVAAALVSLVFAVPVHAAATGNKRMQRSGGDRYGAVTRLMNKSQSSSRQMDATDRQNAQAARRLESSEQKSEDAGDPPVRRPKGYVDPWK